MLELAAMTMLPLIYNTKNYSYLCCCSVQLLIWSLKVIPFLQNPK